MRVPSVLRAVEIHPVGFTSSFLKGFFEHKKPFGIFMTKINVNTLKEAHQPFLGLDW